MALQRGTVDGATTGMPAAVSRKIYEVQKYMTLANYTTAQFFVQGNLIGEFTRQRKKFSLKLERKQLNLYVVL